jgi:hypothetical protein
MNRRMLTTLVAGFAIATLGAGSLMAHDDDDDRGRDHGSRFAVRAELGGFQEVPALSTTGHGTFRAWVDTKANTITFKLTYDTLEAPVTQAHVHFGQKGVSAGVSYFLCSNLGNGPAGTQACPAPPAEVTGVITPELVVGPAGQGIEAGAFAEIVAAMKDDTAYANVHTTKYPAGEIRGQLR